MTLRRLRFFVALAPVAALLYGCNAGAVGGVTPAGAQAAPKSWMAGDAKKGVLLYVSDLGNDTVDVYSYPQGKLKGTLTGFYAVHSGCVDGRGHVFITDRQQILEYDHGGTSPVATLEDTNYGPTGCSVDPVTGNLAVANSPLYGSSPGNIAIYKHAKGSPKMLTTSSVFFQYDCAYDDKGNLYDVGGDFHGFFLFLELPYRSHTFTNLSLNQYITIPGGVQWDGKHVAVEDQGAGYHGSTVYQVKVKGSTATAVGTTTLGGSADVIQFWIYGKAIIGPNIGSNPNVMFWKYPAGGTALKTITGGLVEPVGVTVSPP